MLRYPQASYVLASFAPGFRDVSIDLRLGPDQEPVTVQLDAEQTNDLLQTMMDAVSIAWRDGNLPLDYCDHERALHTPPWWVDEYRKRRSEEL